LKSIHGQTGPSPGIIKIGIGLDGLISEHGYLVTYPENIVNLFIISISGLQDSQVLWFGKDQVEQIFFHHGQSGLQGNTGFHQYPFPDDHIGNLPIAVNMKDFNDFFHFFHGIPLSEQVAFGSIPGSASEWTISRNHPLSLMETISNSNARQSHYPDNLMKRKEIKKCPSFILEKKTAK
jgi:hypothetical protein